MAVSTGSVPSSFAVVGAMLGDAAEESLAFTPFPISHWKKIWSMVTESTAGRATEVAQGGISRAPVPEGGESGGARHPSGRLARLYP